ncbi:unnamed protein product [Owenia fusiformis]|uniref:Uncharacterized protein n=1 Tax=Owenia fusiformis TaxID=6347 RepID=A0A8J1XZQ8_OWEFU|nr:unnamed protein product [Owenia fusiformis]
MILFLSLILCTSMVHTFPSTNRTEEWEVWKNKFMKTYKTQEIEQMKKVKWIENLLFVQTHRQQSSGFDVEMNMFADLSVHDLLATNLETVNAHQHQPNYVSEVDGQTNIPKSWDWRKHGVVGPVHNQGEINDALSIAATDCVESLGAVTRGSLSRLSQQETYECCTIHQPVPDVFQCIHSLGGLCSESDYPKHIGNGTCHSKMCQPKVKVNGSKHVIKANETDLQLAVLKTPVLVYFDASHASFMLYKSGIYSEPACKSTVLDHVLVLVGYGTMGQGRDFWICKNSWGINWGMEGYVLVQRNHDNMCGIASKASYPV